MNTANLKSMAAVLLSLCSCVLFAGTAIASTVLVGNTAATQRLLSVEIDGQVVASNLAYLQFTQVQIAAGERNLRLFDSSSGENFLQPATWDVPDGDRLWLSLAGDGVNRNFVAIRTRVLVASPQDDFHLVYANAAVDRIDFSARCSNPDGLSFGSSLGNAFFGQLGGFGTSHRSCRGEPARYVDGQREGLPALNLDNSSGEVRFLAYVGNGTPGFPLQWVQISGQVVSSPQLSELADTLRLLRSANYWYDSGRFSQGLTLYEVSRSQAVHGFWNSFATDGRAQWLYLDGGVVDPSGRREVLIHDYVIDETGKRVGTPIGRGTLTYIDCNEAELRVVFADESTRAARFRRSVNVASCDAVP